MSLKSFPIQKHLFRCGVLYYSPVSTSEQGMSRSLLCHGLDSRKEQSHWGSCHVRWCSTPLWLPQCSWGCFMETIKGPSDWALEWAVSLLILLEGKMASEMLFSSLFSVCFSWLHCAQRGKKGGSTAVISVVFQTHSWFKYRFPNARLVSAFFNFINSRERKQQFSL